MSIGPLISCVVPVYNGIRDLQRAVASVLSQGPDVELVLVDDCSTDGSRELSLQMSRDETRIVALPLPANRGQGYARNIGVAVASAPYVTFLDQDDEHVPGWYRHALDVLEGDDRLAAVKGEIELVDLPSHLQVTRGDVRWRAIASSVLWNVVMRKVVYGALGGSPTADAYRTREGNEDRVLIDALHRNFVFVLTSHTAARHYVKPNGAAAYFLRRTTVVDNRIEFHEATDVEASGQLAEANSEFLARAAANVAFLRHTQQPQVGGIKLRLAKVAASLLQKMQVRRN